MKNDYYIDLFLFIMSLYDLPKEMLIEIILHMQNNQRDTKLITRICSRCGHTYISDHLWYCAGSNFQHHYCKFCFNDKKIDDFYINHVTKCECSNEYELCWNQIAISLNYIFKIYFIND